jgi:hypothetical protein
MLGLVRDSARTDLELEGGDPPMSRKQARAIRRAGELLKQIMKSNKHQKADHRELTMAAIGKAKNIKRWATPLRLSRKQAGEGAHTSRTQAGELLKQIIPKHGANQNIKDGGDPNVITRTQAADDAGLSERQRKNALRVASVPEDEFTAMVESDNPPTVTKLAEIGTKKQLVDLKGRDPNEFNIALHFVGDFENRLRECKKYDIGKSTSAPSQTLPRKTISDSITRTPYSYYL